MVAQYIEGYKFRTDSAKLITATCIQNVKTAALALDEADCDQDKIDYSSDTWPSLNNVMQAFINLGYVSDVAAVGYIKNQQNDLKYFIRQYGGIIVETKLTTTTYNAYNYDIGSAGTVSNEDFTKGFIAYGYDASYIYLQNSLGPKCGSLGFHRMPWSVATSIIVKGAVFELRNPS